MRSMAGQGVVREERRDDVPLADDPGVDGLVTARHRQALGPQPPQELERAVGGLGDPVQGEQPEPSVEGHGREA